MSDRDGLTGQIVDAAYRLHVSLGPGLLESVYEILLSRDLERRGLRVERQKALSFEYDGLKFSDCFRIDLLIESKVIVEIKSVENLAPQHAKQLLTYLRLSKLPVGLLLNFGAARMKDGIRRVVNGLRSGDEYRRRAAPPIHQ
jgi:iron complex transport system substrate-binding protein